MSDLDTLIRQGLGQLVDSTPIAPSFEQVTRSDSPPPVRISPPKIGGGGPRLHTLLAAAGVTVLVGAALSYALANSGNGNAPARGGAASIRLAGYTAHLPSGYLVSSTKPPACQTFPMSSRPIPLETSSTYTIATPTATACLGVLLSATYGVGRSSRPTPDPLPPPGHRSIKLGAYRAAVARSAPFATICGTVGGEPACDPSTDDEVAVWVQIPSTGGGYHDLVVGSRGLRERELIALVRSALPKRAVAADAGRPPWSVIPACLPGQAPDPFALSDHACSNT